MLKKDKNIQNETLDDYIFINNKTHLIEKKLTANAFFFTELILYSLISLASYFSIYLGTNKFSNQEEIENNIELLTKYFSIDNLENSLLGICIVIGIVSSLNYIVTNSKLSLQPFLHRLTHSFIDLIFLMVSSMLGLFFAVLEFTSVLEITADIEELRNTLKIGIFTLIMSLILYIFILFIININKGKIID